MPPVLKPCASFIGVASGAWAVASVTPGDISPRWQALAILVPKEQVPGFSSEPWANQRGHSYIPQPTPSSRAVSGLSCPGAAGILR